MNQSQSLKIVEESTCGASPSVPVYNCVVILRPLEAGRVSARVANLPGIEIEGRVERDVLFAVVRKFKSKLQECHSSQRPIPWIDPVPSPGTGEFSRFIPVHL